MNTDGFGWYAYLLRCADGTIYAGVTTHLERRVDQHNGRIAGGARYTRVRRPVALVWWSGHDSRSAAQREEAALRQLNRRQKLELIEAFASRERP